ncbi:magnesium/cobalt transporter CorA [Coraliomargarita sp. SDUM461004]|uniref:Magnesium transport protein CorA n=1 Tax=Thalassobacterium sedimentorum TaxID=3041258 RepID=A0ABU1AL17_9BACT|nr:magnesium/cobalt transporter CorA [Coraliomargarita sp. SDUM461004]MDQ8195364.1 magnesium/cobalt transporter CorA [Coraliomargarita sp. SDUM461004]
MKQSIESAKEVAHATSGAIAKTASFITSSILEVGKGVFSPLSRSHSSAPRAEPGAAPGIEQYIHKEDPSLNVDITVIDYGGSEHTTRTFDDIDAALAHPRAANPHVRWINIDGLRPSVVNAVCQYYDIHTLSAEDVIHTYQRPKVEVFDDHMIVIARQLQLANDTLKNEQVSFFLFQDTLITFQEVPGDVFDPVRKRLLKSTGRFRSYKADYLFYALLDSIVDHLFPLLEAYGIAMEEMELEILEDPSTRSQQKLFSMKRDLSLQRRVLWPIRELTDQLYRDESGLIHPDLKTYYRDIQDHTMQVIDLLETYRDTASGLTDLYQTSVGNKMNEIMKVLTIMASFFIPITFFAGVYGMNFEYIPELGWKYAYPVFWGGCLSMTLGLAIFFWRKGWIGPK